MGKSQKKRAMRRHNPMRVPDSHLPQGLASASSSSTKTQEILPIMQKMESVDAGDRKWACVAVSNLIQNDPSTRRLLQGKNIVKALIDRLTDTEEEVVIEAMGSLRNLCVDGGFDICAEMYNKNILTPLSTFIPKISTTLAQFIENPKSAPENAQQLVYEMADNVITTLWCLSETSNKALNAINAMNLTPFLISFLASRDSISLKPVLAAAQCLYVFTDDNPICIQAVRSDASYINTLLSIAHPSANISGPDATDQRRVTLKVLAAGILRNISPVPPPSVASTVDVDKEIVFPVLQPVIASLSLTEVTQSVLNLISQQLNEPKIDKNAIKQAPKSDHRSPAEIELELLEEKLRTVQLALQVMTGACAMLPDPESGIEFKEEADEDDNEGDEPSMDIDEQDLEVGGPKPSSPIDPQSSSMLLPTLVPPLLALIQPTTLSFPPLAAPSPHPPTTSALSSVHISALECLNNIFLSLATSRYTPSSIDHAAGQQVWSSVWNALSVVGTDTSGLGQERRQEIWEMAVGVLWGVGTVWKSTLVPEDEQVKLLMQFCEVSVDPQVRVKCIGTLEALAQKPDAVEGNRIITEYFMSLLPTPGSPSKYGTEPLIQVVSALIDIYSDEAVPYDVNFRNGNYLQQLSNSVEGVKKAVKAINRKEEGGKELRRRGEEIRENLVAFITYRRELRL